ncbi:hypothetical protein IF1G_03258 [Cordyceps javanica]|uniref:Uncharacterized protein n=1 Tax=Cordyceps javanica TaxID=43265 RepID=A0A545V756_9HYPO|nr:hypothetical protein IF1G_03258 [Cordyceps javanica]
MVHSLSRAPFTHRTWEGALVPYPGPKSAVDPPHKRMERWLAMWLLGHAPWNRCGAPRADMVKRPIRPPQTPDSHWWLEDLLGRQFFIYTDSFKTNLRIVYALPRQCCQLCPATANAAFHSICSRLAATSCRSDYNSRVRCDPDMVTQSPQPSSERRQRHARRAGGLL